MRYGVGWHAVRQVVSATSSKFYWQFGLAVLLWVCMPVLAVCILAHLVVSSRGFLLVKFNLLTLFKKIKKFLHQACLRMQAQRQQRGSRGSRSCSSSNSSSSNSSSSTDITQKFLEKYSSTCY